MTGQSDKRRRFSIGVLAEIAERHQEVLRTNRVTEPSESRDLVEWAYAAMERRTSRNSKTAKKWSEAESFKLYLKLRGSAAVLRDVRALRTMLEQSNSRLVELAYRLIFVCSINGEFLETRIAGRPTLRITESERRSEHYWARYLPLLPRAFALKKQEPFASMPRWTTAVAQRVIAQLNTDEWDALTERRNRQKMRKTENAITDRARKLARRLPVAERVRSGASTHDQANDMVELDPVSLGIMDRQLRHVAGFVSKRPVAPVQD